MLKHRVFSNNLRIAKPFFEERGARLPSYAGLMLNMLCDATVFAFDFLYSRKKAEPFSVDADSVPILEEMRKGGVFLAAHYGNHELLGYRLAELGLPLNSASVAQKPLFFNNMLQRKRTFKGKCFAEQKSPKEILAFIEGGGLFAALADQDFRKPCPRKFSERCRGRFLGAEVSCNPLPVFALEHSRGKAAFCGCLREGKSGQTLFLKRISADNLYGEYNSWLEGLILENPEKWYGWVHGRFFSTLCFK